MMDSCQKRKRKLEINGVDRISDLPNAVLCNILSLLPTKNAVAASILSTRWKRLFPFWFSPITLDLDDSLVLYQHKINSPYYRHIYVNFADFVDKLIYETLSDVPCVEVIMLTCRNADDYGYEKVVSWVRAALRLNVRELLLDVVLNGDAWGSLFCFLNGCTGLTRLKLGRAHYLWVPRDFTLPNLKSLLLFGLKLYDFNEMMVGCPVLEELSVRYCDTEECDSICIRSNLLKKLIIEECWNQSKCELIIDAPNLETWIYDDSAAESFSVSNFMSLFMAHISLGPFQRVDEGGVDHYYDENDHFINGDYDEDHDKYSWFDGIETIVNACSRSVQLYLSVCSINALQESIMELPEFQNLSSLALGSVCDPRGWALLARLLYKAPNLEKLTMKEGFWEDGYSSFESLLLIPPNCLELHLKEIEFWEFDEEEDEFKLVEYFLKHGKLIQKLTLSCMPFKKSCSLSRLHMLPKHSKIDLQPRRKFYSCA